MNLTHKFLSEYSEYNWYMNKKRYFVNVYDFLDEEQMFISGTYHSNSCIVLINSTTSVAEETRENESLKRMLYGRK